MGKTQRQENLQTKPPATEFESQAAGVAQNWHAPVSMRSHFLAGAAVGISITVGVPMVISPSRARLTMTSDSSMSRPK